LTAQQGILGTAKRIFSANRTDESQRNIIMSKPQKCHIRFAHLNPDFAIAKSARRAAAKISKPKAMEILGNGGVIPKFASTFFLPKGFV